MVGDAVRVVWRGAALRWQRREGKPCGVSPEKELSVEIGQLNRVHIDHIDVGEACKGTQGRGLNDRMSNTAQQATTRERAILRFGVLLTHTRVASKHSECPLRPQQPPAGGPFGRGWLAQALANAGLTRHGQVLEQLTTKSARPHDEHLARAEEFDGLGRQWAGGGQAGRRYTQRRCMGVGERMGGYTRALKGVGERMRGCTP